MKTIHYYFAVVSLLFGLLGCEKLPEYSNVPSISLKEVIVFRDHFSGDFQANGDSMVYRIYFEDGDGDLGIAEEDKGNSGFNYFMEVEKYTNGSFILQDYGDFTKGKFSELAPPEVGKPIDGILDYSYFFLHSSFAANDTVRCTIYIKDRAGNTSNTVTTDEIIVRKQ